MLKACRGEQILVACDDALACSRSGGGEHPVIVVGLSGVGKTHLAIRLAIAAAQSGRRVYYGIQADLIHSLEEAQGAGKLIQRI